MDQKRAEQLWRGEKYNVMYHSQKYYNAIRQAMKNKSSYDEVAQLISEALSQTPTEGSMRNACQHMWGYFKKYATTEEKMHYEKLMKTSNFTELLVFIKVLAEKYEVKYLLESRVLGNGKSPL